MTDCATATWDPWHPRQWDFCLCHGDGPDGGRNGYAGCCHGEVFENGEVLQECRGRRRAFVAVLMTAECPEVGSWWFKGPCSRSSWLVDGWTFLRKEDLHDGAYLWVFDLCAELYWTTSGPLIQPTWTDK